MTHFISLGHPREELNLIPERNQFDEKPIATEITSGDNSDAKTFIKYENDENLEIKEEILQGMNSFVMKISYVKSWNKHFKITLK